MNAYTFHITPYDLAFLGTIFIGLNFTLLLWFAKRITRAENRFLAMALLTVVLWMAWILGVDIRLGAYFPRWNWLPLQFLLILGPLVYFYVLKITRPEYKLGWKDLLHFCPLLIQQGVLILEINENIRTGVPTYDTLTFREFNPVLQLLTFISVITYLYWSHRLIEHFYQRVKFNNVSDRYRYELRWMNRLLTGFGLLWLLWIPYIALDYFYYHSQLSTHAYYPLYLLFAVAFTRIAIVVYLRPELGMPADALSFLKPPLPAEMKQRGTWLKNTVRANLYYQDPELSLSSLAEKLELGPHELSRIINTVLKKSFNDFINEYRVGEVVQKMQDPANDHITLLGIAYDSGFNSKSAFHRIFKEKTGKSPAEYKADLKKELPSYNLGQHSRFATVISFQKTTPKWAEEKLNRNYMFRNYFKTAWRNLSRNKSYAAINIIGLAIGIASCLIIFLIVQYETSFDNFHQKKARIYRIITASKGPQGLELGSGVPFPTAEALRLDFPQLPVVATILRNGKGEFGIGNNSNHTAKKFSEDETYYAEPQFFNAFDFGWLAGDKKTALAGPNAVVLTQSEAERFFGNWRDAAGKIIKYNNKTDLKVTGILKDMPANTDFPLKVVISYASTKVKGADLYGKKDDWVSIYSSHYCFIVLPSNITVAQFNQDLAAFVKKHKPAENVKDGMRLQPLSDIHYNTAISKFTSSAFSRDLLKVISLIGLFLLIIACVNFINLATAQAVNRSKEVGIRKVLGSGRKQLIIQFISETFVVTFFAVVLAVIITLAALPLFNNLLKVELNNSFIYDPSVLLFITGVIVGVTLLAGFYPALVLSGFSPISALKNKIAVSRASGVSLRRGLVIFQFCIAQVLVIGTLIIISQMNYFKNQPLGFVKDAVITVPIPHDSVSMTKLNSLRDQLLLQPGISNVSYSFASPSDNSGWSSEIKYNNSPKETNFDVSLKWADPEYFDLYKIQFVAGHAYAKTDTIHGYVVNETLLKKLGVRDPREAIGKYIGMWDDKSKYAPIVGVIKDFNVSSLKDEIPPVLLASWKGVYQKLNIKIQPANVNQTLASVERLWTSTFPDGMYEYQFLDEKIANFYKNEDRLSQLYKIFAGIAICISCMGLYGLVSFMTVQRNREVGIRKTLGASVSNIVYLFSKEFTILILIAFGVSAPVAYYLMHRWLQAYTYRITVGPEIFILAILASVTVAWLTVGYKAIKAALANPVKSLRSE